MTFMSSCPAVVPMKLGRSVWVRVPHVELPPKVAAVVNAAQTVTAAVPECRVVHQYSLWVQSRVDHHRLAVSTLRSGDWTDRLIVVAAATMADVGSDRGRVMMISCDRSASEQTSLTHCTCVPCDACLMFLLGSLLLLPSPQEEKNATYNGSDTSDASDDAPNNGPSIARATAGSPRLRCSSTRLEDNSSGNHSTTFSDNLNVGGHGGGR